MKIILTPEESEKFFYNALCNGLSYIGGYGLEMTYDDDDYKKARKKLKDPCYEDVLMQILKDGNSLTLVDHELDGEYTKSVTLKDVHKGVEKTDAHWILQMENGDDDAVTADCILQSVFYGEVLFG
jgi:hypothetical protein